MVLGGPRFGVLALSSAESCLSSQIPYNDEDQIVIYGRDPTFRG